MNLEINYYWGMLGILGFLGYILENPVYYVFFIFFLLFLIPVYSKKKENNLKEENNKSKEKSRPSSTMGKTYNLQNVSIWLGSAALMFSGLTLMITKTMSDLLSVLLLLGIMALITNFFT